MRVKQKLPKQGRTRRYLILFVAIISIVFVFLTWYKIRYSMSYVTSYQVNSDTLRTKVLIATQGSKFKSAVVDRVVESLRERPIYIKVEDISLLPYWKEETWSAIVILHTWEYSNPQRDAQEFVQKATLKNKIIVVSTSGSGKEKLEGVDGISSASNPDQVRKTSDWILSRLEQVLPESANE